MRGYGVIREYEVKHIQKSGGNIPAVYQIALDMGGKSGIGVIMPGMEAHQTLASIPPARRLRPHLLQNSTISPSGDS